MTTNETPSIAQSKDDAEIALDFATKIRSGAVAFVGDHGNQQVPEAYALWLEELADNAEHYAREKLQQEHAAEVAELKRGLEISRNERNCARQGEERKWLEVVAELRQKLADEGDETGEFQDAVRDDLVEALDGVGLQGFRIDGGGCDSGDWRDFTQSEIQQGVGMLTDEICELRRQLVEKTAECERAHYDYSGVTTLAAHGLELRRKQAEDLSQRLDRAVDLLRNIVDQRAVDRIAVATFLAAESQRTTDGQAGK